MKRENGDNVRGDFFAEVLWPRPRVVTTFGSESCKWKREYHVEILLEQKRATHVRVTSLTDAAAAAAAAATVLELTLQTKPQKEEKNTLAVAAHRISSRGSYPGSNNQDKFIFCKF